MGSPFSNSKKVQAASVTNRALGNFDDPLPGIVAGATVTNQNITTEIVSYLTNGLFRKTENFFNYGRDHFVRGLPQQVTYDAGDDYAEIRRIISNLNGGSKIQLQYVMIDDTPDIEHHVAQYLQDFRQMNPDTLKINNKSGLPVSGATNLFFKEYIRTPSEEYPYGYIWYEFINNSEPDGLFEEAPGPVQDRFVWQVAYTTTDDNGVANGPRKFFTYEIGTGTHPTLDNPNPTGVPTPSEYYPIIPFYEDKVQIGAASNKGTPLHDTSKKAMQKLGFDYYQIVDLLAEGTDESIGNDKGLYAYLQLAAEVTAGLPKFADAGKSPEELALILTEAQATLTYLIEYFLYLEKKQTITYNYWELTQEYINVQQLPTHNMFEIQDESYKHTIYFNYIHSEIKSGVIGEVDWCTIEHDTENKHYTTYYSVFSTEENPKTFSIGMDKLIYRKQLTSNTYMQITVDGLREGRLIFKTASASVRPRDAFNEDPLLMTLPLHRPTVLKIKSSLRNRLMHASLMFTFNAYQIVEVKWYQSGFWAFAINIVAIAFALPTGGQSIAWSQALTAAGLAAAGKAFLIYVFKYWITTRVIEEIAEEFGAEVAFIIASLAMAYGKFGQPSSGVAGMPWASDILKFGTAMWSGASKELKNEMQQVQKDYAKLQSESDKLNTELEKAEGLLDTEMIIDPWLFINQSPDLIMSHTPDQYRATRINTNPGLITLQAANNYVELMLTLPTIDDSLKT